MKKNARGVSLVEVMIATAMLSIVVLGGVQSFSLITKSIRASRSKTIAANLIQERMEVLKNMSYYQLLVTTDTEVNTTYTPNLVYDRTSYPKETITLWGLPAFNRAVFISYATVSGNTASAAASNSYDTGLKMITVYLWWTADNVKKKLELRSLYANPDASNLDSGFKGMVYGYAGGILSNARISVIGNPEWSATSDSDATANFMLPVTGGTYSLLYGADGYYDKIVSGQICVRGAYTTVPAQTLTQVSTGTLMGTVWISTNIVISQIVASTPTALAANAEYVELYNPTTFSWLADDAHLQLWYNQKELGAPSAKIPLTYVSASIPSYAHYLIANQTSITIGGITRIADAVYQTLDADMIKNDVTGGLCIKHEDADGCYDAVAWGNDYGGGDEPPTVYTFTEPLGPVLHDNDQYVRYTSTNDFDSSLGSAYNTYNNIANFRFQSPIAYGPRNSGVTRTPVTGVPAHGAVVTATDGYSSTVFAGSSGMGTSAEYAVFELPGVTTGTWSVTIADEGYFRTLSDVAVTQGAIKWIPDSGTNAAWPASGYYSTILVSTTSGGYLAGYVYGDGADYWTPLASILVEANGVTVRTASNGYFLINTATGSVTVNANHNSDAPTYVTASENTTVILNEVVMAPDSPYFHLASAGRIYGYVTSGSAAVPNIVVKAVRGVTVYEATTNQTGYFYMTVPISGVAYTVTPVLDPIQSFTSVPDPITATVSGGSYIHVGTITVIGGAGTISGTVREGSSIITTGVLIVASEAPLVTIGNPPPLVYASSAPGQAFTYYSASSLADGTYSLSVRASAAMNMRAYYWLVDPNTGALKEMTPKDIAAVNVTAGGATTGQNFTW